jgi:hypothetical protein
MRRRRRTRRRDGIWNRLSCVIIILFVLITCLVSYIYINPTSWLNPFPPPTEPALIVLPTFDETIEQSMATRTATSTQELVTVTSLPTFTQIPKIAATDTPEPSPTVTNINSHNPATTPIPTKIINGEYTFTLQGEPKFLDASTFNSKHSCNWQGIAGQTFDLLNRPLPGILVQVSGKLGDQTLEMINLTGTILTYGSAGYEVFLTNKLTESQETLWVRLIDEDGKPLSDQVKINTSSSCNENLVVVNFKQVK